MKYYKGMNYILVEPLVRKTDIKGFQVSGPFGTLTEDGKLCIDAWFPWDGNSGPCPNWKSTLEASCVHDILCMWVNDEILPKFVQPMVDQEYYNICVEHGLFEWVARIRLSLIRWYMLGRKRFYHRPVYEA